MMSDTWASGSSYEPYMGRWSRLVAAQFVDWLAVPHGRDWLDVGCGTGALSDTILQQAAPAAVTGVDSAEPFVIYAREHIRDDRASFKVADAMALPFGDGLFDAVVSGLALNFVPRPDVAVPEMVRVAAAGATVAAYVWDYAGEMQMMRIFWDVAVEIDPAAAERDEGARFAFCMPEPLARLFTDAGLARVEVRAIDVLTRFRDFDDYWQPFLRGQGPAAGYATALPDAKQAVLAERLRARLPRAADGSISLVARAWAVRGSPPAV
jgi:SAM-dependent methyltransferase